MLGGKDQWRVVNLGSGKIHLQLINKGGREYAHEP